MKLNRNWEFGHGLYGGFAALMGNIESKGVNLPHDYMIESNVKPDAPAGAASGFFTEGVAYYTRKVEIPAEWEGEQIYLKFDGVMMNATVDINGGKAALQHNGYIPFTVDITPYLYFGQANRITVIVNPSMQPNSRWYSGAGIFRDVELVHVPKVHIADKGIYGYTKEIEYDETGKPVTAFLHTEMSVENSTDQNKMVLVESFLIDDATGVETLSAKQKIQVGPKSTESARITMTLDNPKLWSPEKPNLYRLGARVTTLGTFITHFVAEDDGTTDEAETIFGVRTVTADVKHGLRINGKVTKLKGGCLHHDNGILGAVSMYDSEYRKLSILKEIGFNAVRTTHNPPSSCFLEACDRLGMLVFDEAFDAWGIMKQPGDYNMFFETDWEKDLRSFIRRDRNHPSVIIWSTGNEIGEHGGLNDGYLKAKHLADTIHEMDASRPVSDAICSYWNGLDDILAEENMKKFRAQISGENAGIQNVDLGQNDTSWEEMSEAFANGLDIVGYNYLEDKYPLDHEMYPERVIMGSENYPKEIGKRWPMVESTPYVIGDFTWTAFDYIGEAGIGKSIFVNEDDPRVKMGSMAVMSHNSGYPWRLANDADVDINGSILPQGKYRSVVWGDKSTYLFSYDPATYGLTEIVGMWGFTAGVRNWNWKGQEGKPVKLLVFSRAEEVEVLINEKSLGRKKAGEALAVEDLPLSFVFEGTYEPGTVTAVSYENGKEISRDTLKTSGPVAKIELCPEKTEIAAGGESLAYVRVNLVDAEGQVVFDTDMELEASLDGAGELLGFGSANPITEDNYTVGKAKAYRGSALAIIRSGESAGEAVLTVKAEGLADEKIAILVK